MDDFTDDTSTHRHDTREAFNELLTTFEQFKHTNDDRFAALEGRQREDVLITEKLNRIDAELDAQQALIATLTRKTQRPRLSADARPAADVEHKDAFDVYVRKGETQPLSKLDTKALSVGSEADGGYLVPAETETTINTSLPALSPIRAMASVRRVSSSVYKRPFSISGATAGWISETGARAQTGTPGLSEMAFPTMELFAMPAATMTLLDDTAVNIDEWLADEVNIAFAGQESAAFVSGDGNGKPKGFLAYTAVANSSWTWGNIGYVATGVAGGFPTNSAADKLIDLVYALKSPYRTNAAFAMSRMTQSALRKLKDGQGNYLWQPALAAGAPATLLGFPVAEVEEMPDIAASSNSIAFGDFKRGYLVVDRIGVRVLRDHFSAKPYVLFYTTKRVGGGVQDFNAIKLLKFAVS